jgi:hypothetical protein
MRIQTLAGKQMLVGGLPRARDDIPEGVIIPGVGEFTRGVGEISDIAVCIGAVESDLPAQAVVRVGLDLVLMNQGMSEGMNPDGSECAMGEGQLLEHLGLAGRIEVVDQIVRGGAIDGLGNEPAVAVVVTVDGPGLALDRGATLHEAILKIEAVKNGQVEWGGKLGFDGIAIGVTTIPR